MRERDRIGDRMKADESCVIDVHSHCGTGYYNVINKRYPSSQSVADLALKTRLAGVDYVVTFPFPGSAYYFDAKESLKGNRNIPNPLEEFPYFFENRQLFYEVSLFGEDRVLPFANVYPGHQEQKQADYLAELGKKGALFGLKLHTLATQKSALSLHKSPLLEVARHYSLPVLVHSGPDQISYPQNVVELARGNRDIRFCIAHVGRFEKKVFDGLNARDTNIYFDTSPFLSIAKVTPLDINRGVGGEKLPLPYEHPAKALKMLCQMYPERIMWGSDEPYTTMTVDREGGVLMKVSYQDEVDLLNTLPDDIRLKITHDTTTRFLFGN